MACRIPDYTVSEVINAVRTKQLNSILPDNPTAEEIRKGLLLFRNIATTAEIDNNKLRQGDYLDFSGKTARYVDTVTGELLFEGRTSDTASANFVKKMGKDKAKAINEQLDNKIKAESGNKVHRAMQDIIEIIVEGGEYPNILKNTYGYKFRTSSEIAADLGLTTDSADFKSLIKLGKSIVKEVSELQKKINPNEAASIFTEQFLFDPLINEGGTEDVVVIFSDKSNFIYDYKTITPNDTKKERVTDGKYRLISEDWIPSYKLEDFKLTLPKHIKKLAKFGSAKNRGARILPIHIEHRLKPKDTRTPGNVLTSKISQITASPLDNPLLAPIPIVKEETGFKALDEALDKLVVLRNNLEVKISKAGGDEKTRLGYKLKNVTRSINSIIVNKDLDLLYEEIGRLTKIYNLNDILNTGANSKIPLSEKRELLQEIEALITITSNSMYYFEEMNFSEEEINKREFEYNRLAGALEAMVRPLREAIANEVLTESQRVEAKRTNKLGFTDKTFSTRTEIRDPIFDAFNDKVDLAYNKNRLFVQTFEEELKSKALKLEEWGNNNGYRGLSVYKLLFNEEKGNLYAKFNSDIYKEIKDLQAKKNREGLKKILELKPDYQEKFERKLSLYIKYNPKATEEQIKKWKKENSPEEIILTKDYFVYYKIKNDVDSKYYTEGYNNIRGNKALLDYYTFWEESMSKARGMLGLINNYNQVPNNFLPWIKADVLDQLFQGTADVGNVLSSMRDILYVSQDNQTFGNITDKNEINPADGTILRQVPRFFIEPLTNKDNKIDSTLKSLDLNKSLLTFMAMAANYKNMTEIQAHVEALKDVIIDENFGEVLTDDRGNPILDISGRVRKQFGTATTKKELLSKHIDYHLYGVKIQDDFSKNVTQALLSAKKFQQLKELGLAPLVQMANIAGAKINAYYMGVKGFSYNNEQMLKAHKLAANYLSNNKEGELYRALTNFWEPYPGSKVDLKAKEVSSLGSVKGKWVGTELAFAGFRLGDENIDNTILVAMLQNWGIDSDGSIKRIKRLPKGSKSLLDRSSVKDGKLFIEGITDQSEDVKLLRYTQFRNIVLGTARSVKGGLNSEDMNAINMSLMGNLMMSFKNWMPGLVTERFGNLKYNRNLNVLTEGRYRAFVNDLSKEDKSIVEFVTGVVLPQAGKLLGEIATFGLFKYKVNQERAKQLFNEYKAKYPDNEEIQKMSFEDYMDYKQGQIRALASELRVILGFILALSMLGGDWDDDGQADYKASKLGRTSMRLGNRIRRELVGIINPEDWVVLFRQPLPITGLAIDLNRWVNNTTDSFRDIVMGENYKGVFKWELDKNDQKPILYETFRWIPGHKLIQTFEPFDKDKKREY